MKTARAVSWRALGHRALPGLSFCLLVVAVYSPTLFSRRNFAGRDLVVYNLPIEKAIHAAYSNGELPVWIPEISGGRPLAANPNAGAFYPVRPLLSLLPFPAAMRIYPVLHWVAAGLGMLLLVRSLGGSRPAAWMGAVTYSFSGVAVSEVFYTNYQPGMTLLPWIVWAVERRNVSEGFKLLTLSLLYGLIFFAGDVFTIGIAIFSSLLWILLERERRERLREVLLLGLSLLLAGLAAAPQVVAALLWVPDTNRAILGMRLGEALYFSVSPLRLIELVVPFPFGPTWSLEGARTWGWPVFQGKTIGFFTTMYSGALSLIALTESWKWRPAGARFARVLFVFAFAVATLPSLVPPGWGGLPSPLPLRFPEKFAVAFVFALAILSGLAFDRFRAAAAPRRWILAAGALLAALAGAAAIFPDRAAAIAVEVVGASPAHPKPPGVSSDRVGVARPELPRALAEGGLLWIATAVALDLLRRPGRGAVAGALLLLTAVPIASNRKIAQTTSEEAVFRPTPFARFLDRADPAGRYRTLGVPFYRSVSPMQVAHATAEPQRGGESWTLYRHVLYGRGTVFNFDFDVGDFARVESVRALSSVLTDGAGSDVFFGSFALRFGIRFRDQKPLPGYERIGGTALQDWDEMEDALPDVRLAETWREERGPLESARALTQLTRGQLVIETGTPGRGRARPGRVRILPGSRAAELHLEAEAPDPTWLFVLRGFWNYRRVLLDGKPVETVPAQLGFSAVAIPAGRHTIEWTEHIPGLEVSRFGPPAAVALLGLLLFRDRRRRYSPS